MNDGWDESASAWIAEMGERGDHSRKFVLDPPMMARVRGKGFVNALDVGCGEGRFCRMLEAEGVKTIGVDPTEALVEHARRMHPDGDYRLQRAESLGFPDSSFDLVVSYLTLIDIPGIEQAISEMARVLRPGGALLIANLNAFFTAGPPEGWTRDAAGELRFFIDNYLKERSEWAAWRGIRVRNWHRPLSAYMSLLLAQKLDLRYFAEPTPSGGEQAKAERYRRVPFFHIMEWRKPA